MTGRIIEAELRITGSDKSGAAFAGVIAHARELEKALGGMKGLKLDDPGFKQASNDLRERTRLLGVERRAVDELRRSEALLNNEIAKRQGLLGRAKGLYNSAAGQLGLMATGAFAGHTIRRSAVDAAELGHQRALLAAGGMNAGDIAHAVESARKAAGAVPATTMADSLKAIGELRMVFGSTEHAIEHLTPVLKATAAMRAVNPAMNAEEESYNLARALELKGVSNDPEHFTKLTDMMVQAVNASRGKITGSEFFEFTKYARGGAQRLTDDFYTRVAPTLIQELGGHSAGMALSSFRQTLVGGKMTNKASEEFAKLGLLNKKSIIKTKTGSVKGVRPGGLVGADLANEDPYAWVQQVLKPALDKHGIKSPNRVAEELAHLFGNRNSEQMANILLTQKQRIDKDRGLIQGAPGASSIDALRNTDPKTALRDLAAGVTDFLAAVGDPLMKPAIAGMNALSSGVRSIASHFSELATSHPLLAGAGSALGLGAGGYLGLKGVQAGFGMLGGFGLKGSAVALNEAAGALTAAATRMGVAGAAGAAGKLAGGAVATGSALAAGVLGGSTVAGGIALSEAAAGMVFAHPKQFDFSGNPMLGAMGGDYSLAGALANREVKAELQGTVQTEVTVKVEPSPDFITRAISSVKSFFGPNITSPTGSTGSTGRSMPESGPMP